MKFRYLAIGLILMVILFTTFSVNPLRAAPLPGDHYTLAPAPGVGGTCNATSWSANPAPESFQFSQNWQATFTVTLNGSQISTGAAAGGPNSFNGVTSGYDSTIWGGAYNIPSMTYTYQVHETY